MKAQLHAYLGIDEGGDLALYICPGRLNKVGVRVEKGTPLPRSIYRFEDHNSTAALRDLQDYFNQQVNEKKRSRKNVMEDEIIRKYKATL